MAYGLTQSIQFASASSQQATRANTGSTGLGGNATDLTFEFWLKLTSLPGAGSNMAVASKWKTGGGGGDYSYIFALRNDAGVYGFQMYTSSGSGKINFTPSTGVWYHVAFVYTLSTNFFQLFVNGVSQGTSSSIGTISTSLSQFAFAEDDGAEFLNGQLSLVRFWTTKRTSTQLSDNSCVVLGSTANLSAEWTFNNVVTDNSGNSNTLTAVNTPTFPSDVPSVCTTVISLISRRLLLGVGN